jgi:heat shock protein HslJ
MAQETAFLEALPRGTTFRIEANRLEIRDDGGALQLAARRAD